MIGGKAAVIDVHPVRYRTARGADNVDAFGAVQRTARKADAAAVGGGDAGVVCSDRSRASARDLDLAGGHIVHLTVTDDLGSFGVRRGF